MSLMAGGFDSSGLISNTTKEKQWRKGGEGDVTTGTVAAVSSRLPQIIKYHVLGWLPVLPATDKGHLFFRRYMGAGVFLQRI